MKCTGHLLRGIRMKASASFLWKLLLVLGILIIGVGEMYAGRGDKIGTASGAQLLIPVGARSIGLGSSVLATASGVEAMYWNPAGLATMGSTHGVLISHMSYLADIDVQSIAAAIRLDGVGALGFAVKSLAFGDIAVTTEDFPDGTGETISPTFMTVGMTYSRRMSQQISLGVTSNLIIEKMGEVSAMGVAFNAGVQYEGLGGVKGLSFGVAMKNIGPKMKYDGDGLLRNGQLTDITRPDAIYKIEAAESELPSTIEIGLGFTQQYSDYLTANYTGTFQNNNFSDDEFKVGIEGVLDNKFSVRLGSAFSSSSGDREYLYGVTLGLGLNATVQDMDIRIDYAYRDVKYLYGNHVFCIGLEF